MQLVIFLELTVLKYPGCNLDALGRVQDCIDLENRFCFVGALVIGDEILLVAVPMEDMPARIPYLN